MTMDVAAGAVAVVVVALVVVTVVVLRRGSRHDEVHSVEGYRHRLSSIEQLSQRRETSVRVLDEPSLGSPGVPGPVGAAPGAARATVVPVPVPLAAPVPPPAMPPGAVDALHETDPLHPATPGSGGTVGNGTHPADGLGPLPPLSPRGGRRTLEAMNRRAPRVGGPLLVVVVLLAALGGLLYLGVQTKHPQHPSADHTHGAAAAGKGSKSDTGTTSGPPPTTTLPASYNPVAYTDSTATYVPPQTSYTVVVAATTGTCWMSVTEADGTSPFSGLLVAGTSMSFKLTGTSSVVLGAPWSASITLDRASVVLPSGATAPFVVTLVPAS